MRVVLRAAGKATRWGNYGNIPKHYAKVLCVPTIVRTVDLIRELRPDARIYIITAQHDDLYDIDGTTQLVDIPTEGVGDIDKIASTFRVIGDLDDDYTLIMFGDVWWSYPGIKKMLETPVVSWRAFLRFGPGGVGGEIFAFGIHPGCSARVRQACADIAQAHRDGETRDKGHKGGELRGGWALFRALNGKPFWEHGNWGNATIIKDFTEDFDSPRGFKAWKGRWKAASPQRRAQQWGPGYDEACAHARVLRSPSSSSASST